MKKIITLVVIMALIFVATLMWLFRDGGQRAAPTPKIAPSPGGEVFCTQDAKECPDGSYVGRTEPKCEFAPCPAS